MKIIVNGPFKNNINNIMRDLGYHFQGEDPTAKELGFTRPRIGYPRLHLFIKPDKESVALSLHLDQKKPVYQGSVAHSGEYDGPVVEREMARIEKYLESCKR
ncbi:MAG: hypothetical protein L7H18_03270 [Candidatus Nealsonbacteria bacterium DGGOD1a]|nr:MAG: hypothetical protein L7H18_03270 [Candidatus Nealsonbacteria bacterium DGGOD1a]